ncbi:MAG: hypothetical protein LBJ44_10450 [Propionibacteriaceae bacterium]|jgi:hypothetical protein|nr:hypothetical protein [Propionibacteriaceae bacterium]
MTLVITGLAAVIMIAWRFARPVSARRLHLGALALIYSGAALMWCVDGVAALAAGESFIELSDQAVMADDALLGLGVVGLGLVIWAVILVRGRRRPASLPA